MMYLESRLNRASKLRQIKAELEFEDKQEALSYTADGMKSLADTINALVDAEKIYSGVSANAGKTLRDIINNLQVNFSELQKCYSYMTGKQPDDAILKEEEDFKEEDSARRFRALRSRLNRLRRSSVEDFNDPNYADEINQQDLDQLEQEYEDSLAKERFKRERINRYNYPDDDFYDDNELYSRCRSRLNKYELYSRCRSGLNKSISDYRDDGTEKKYKQFFPEVLMKELQNTFPKVNLELLENDGRNITLGVYENEKYNAQLILANADPKSNKELAYVVYVEDKKDNQNILNGGSGPRYISFADLTNDTKRSEYFKEVKAFIDNLNKDDTEEK